MDLSANELLMLCALIFMAAGLYSAVGHAGASGYLAAMALFGLSPAIMKPTALVLNILVAGFATVRLQRAGLINWKLLAPFVVTSVPLAFIGGAVRLPDHLYRVLIGMVLLAAALRLFIKPKENEQQLIRTPSPYTALLVGGAVGLLSGLSGTGGGIFLTPLLLFFGWTGTRQASGISAPFILANSVAGIAGNFHSISSLPKELSYMVPCALLGAILGTQFAIKWLRPEAIQRVLALVLTIAAAKFVLT
ncbi:hypothetical protein ABAC460_17085 [Asticcacaulis sp. AC460]|uniref:sulfite exporter TauE/SafE family protein n=1 Tax=Asticcacaulis sp. AC460 TaxID=1282360 RepID=UPI0003C3ECE6|nr:sulfite exporter TauE/SafE family protein [Asticcacaulis sp. AC460]ESQ87905.1 hypothetical protein ABAC460_17085 [Asticcacaulis sp. AC460]